MASRTMRDGMVAFGSFGELFPKLFVEAYLENGRGAVPERWSSDSATSPIDSSFYINVSGFGFVGHLFEVGFGKHVAVGHGGFSGREPGHDWFSFLGSPVAV
jgi:hypothetical protein